METTAIRQLLKSLCTNSTWRYAVFWKIQQQNHMLLTCEDWYCEDSKFQQSCPLILSDDYSRQEDGIHFGFETNFWIGDSMGYSLGPAIADMSCQQYELGEGLVGRVALSGNDIWIYSDDINSTEFISKLECPDDWLLPIMAGIMTTLLVPILPHGVLQFGSLDKVAENLEVVADIKEKFIALQCPTFTLPFASDENPLLFSSILMSEMENTDESSFSSNNLPQRMESEDSLELHTPELTENEFSTADQVQIPYKGELATREGKLNSFAKSTSPSSFESLESSIIEDEHPMEFAHGMSNKSLKLPKPSRGRARPKSNHKPRPRDRQLIQDRLKELREVLPNGSNYSIDGLLDKTIQHIMFLKSVTERAEKVKQFNEQEFNAEKSKENTSSHPNGASWAVEVGDNLGSCPIVVKDLENPGQILIQMLCNNNEVFFEMVEVMQQLKLTILKGVMESRRNKWAHFIVEASKGFNRLDIFWPLMRILQRNGNWMTNQCP